MSREHPGGGAMSQLSNSMAVVELGFETEQEFLDEYARNLAYGAVFVPDEVAHAPDDRVCVRLRFHFCDSQIELGGAVVVVVTRAMTTVDAIPGVSLQLDPAGEPLQSLLEEASGLSLPSLEDLSPPHTRSEARVPARVGAELEVLNCSFRAETVDVSYNGMLVLVSGVDLSLRMLVRATLIHPSGESLSVEARVMNRTRCDHGVTAFGVQFVYAIDRADEVATFVDSLGSFHHARQLGAISGSVVDTPLEGVLETFSALTNAGTLRLESKNREGRIVYRDGQIVLATTGLVSGTKALGRMFSWTDARFDFEQHPEDCSGQGDALPLDSLIVTAALERDELAHLDLARLPADIVMALDEERYLLVKDGLSALQMELVENAAMGFPLGAILDIVPTSDAEIYKAISELANAGILSID